MGYFDKYLMHEDGRDKGMNSTSSEKGTDGKKNNTSEYNHQYYMKNKEKWRDNKSVQGGAGYKEYDENDHDFDEENYNEKNRVGGTDFFIKEKPDGSLVVLEEDMKWTLPPGTNKEDVAKAIEAFDKEIVARREKATTIEEFKAAGANWFKEITEAINKAARGKSGGEKEFDVDAAARDVIRGKYGNGAERRAALGDDYAEVQKRVNEILGGKTSSEPKKTSKNTSKPVDGPKETPHANFPSSNSTNSAPRAREKNVTGNGTGLYRRGSGLNNVEEKKKGNRNTMSMKHYFVDASESLEHHGIKGQKWGVRRFEKAGGGLTAAGKARYQTDSNGNYKKIGDSGGSTSSSKSRKAEYKAKYNAYSKKYDEWSKKQDQNDSEWNKVQEMRKGLGKTGLTRTINAARNKSDGAKAYNKAYDKWSKTQDKLDKEWGEVKSSKPSRLTDKQKKALKIGAAVTATALATYGVYKVNQLNKKAKAGLSEIDKFDAKVLLDRSNDYRKNAFNLAEVARKNHSEGRVDAAKSLLETSNSMLNRGNYDKASADKLLERAQKANYSLREKNLYLQSQSDSFSGTDKLIMDLLKKNSATLSSLGF